MLCFPDRRDTAGRKQKEEPQNSTEKLTAQRKYVHILSMYVLGKKHTSFLQWDMLKEYDSVVFKFEGSLFRMLVSSDDKATQHTVDSFLQIMFLLFVYWTQ